MKHKKSVTGITIAVVSILIITLTLLNTHLYYANSAKDSIIEIKNIKIEHLENKLERLEISNLQAEEQIKEVSKREVLFSNYYIGDGSSGNVTASGLTTIDFKVIDGMYTYQGKIVLATGSNRLKGLKNGFIAHELYEELTVVVNDIEYPGIVVDVCGTCTWGKENESLQRIDIFTTDNIIGLQKGYVIEG